MAWEKDHRAEALEPRYLLAAVLVKDFTTTEFGSHPTDFAALGNLVVFAGFDSRFESLSSASLKKLWVTDGTEAGTRLIKDGLTDISRLTTSQNLVYFVASTPQSGKELWRTDGTPEGTLLVKDLLPGTGSSDPAELIDVNGTLFFAATRATSPSADRQLWKSDGTEAGTTIVSYHAPSRNPVQLTNINGMLFFAGSGPALGQLWKTDGTDAGTVVVKDDSRIVSPTLLSPFKNGLIFSSSGGIWTSDGTSDGTIRVTTRSVGTKFVEVNGSAFFATAGSFNRELWKTDGTATGTVLVKDINPGTNSSDPSNLVRFGDIAISGLALPIRFRDVEKRRD